MRHLLICPEFPPAQGGGIGTYALEMARILADAGETVHVIAQLWKGVPSAVEVSREGRLTVHRVPYLDWRSPLPRRPHRDLAPQARRLFFSEYHPQAFAWQAALLAERLIDDESIDVVEAQEYEAPLYFLQLRRALGLGAAGNPPLIVHLHSPSETILRHNDYPVGHPALVAAQFEDYSIRAADALLSPSRYLAAQTAERFGMAVGEIEVIGYPIGATSALQRDAATWGAGRVCYVGRLEGRKGVLEWIDAAVMVAASNPACSFDFIGENVLGDGSLPGKTIVERRIPRHLDSRFRFHGRRPREELQDFLRQASFAVVPSRWDNFPNTCIEAMSSGLPVLATREGGMAELIEDGRSGWLATRADDVELARVLGIALATPPGKLAEMGGAAATRIRQLCDNDDVTRRQLDFRRRLMAAGAGRSMRIPLRERGSAVSVPDVGPRDIGPLDDGFGDAEPGRRRGLVVVISESTGRRAAGGANRCLDSLRRQSSPAAALVVAGDSAAQQTPSGWPDETRVLTIPGGGDLASRCNRAVQAVGESGLRPAGFAFVESDDLLEPTFVERCDAVLAHRAEVGIVSFWTRQDNASEAYRMRPCPTLPFQWLRNEAARCSVVRAEALAAVGPLRTELRGSFALWDLVNAVLQSGWAAVTLPELLARHTCPEETEPSYPSSFRMRRLLVDRFADQVGDDAPSLLQMAAIDPRLRLRDGSMSQRERFDLLLMLLGRSGSLIRWFLRVVTDRLNG